jgi:hypothetical protein
LLIDIQVTIALLLFAIANSKLYEEVHRVDYQLLETKSSPIFLCRTSEVSIIINYNLKFASGTKISEEINEICNI